LRGFSRTNGFGHGRGVRSDIGMFRVTLKRGRDDMDFVYKLTPKKITVKYTGKKIPDKYYSGEDSF